MPDTLKNDIVGWLDELHEQCDRPARMDNRDTLLCDVYIWQEIAGYASKKHTEAMKDLATLVPADDELRAQDVGEHTVESGRYFAFVTKIATPRQTFDAGTFMTQVARKWKVPLDKLKTLANTTYKETKAALSKRVIEL